MAQVDGFATGNQLLGQIWRLLKIDVPSDGTGFNRIPRPKANGVEKYCTSAASRIATDERIRNHATDIVTDHVNVVQM